MPVFRRRRACLTIAAAIGFLFTFKLTLQLHKLLVDAAGSVMIVSVEDPVIAYVNEVPKPKDLKIDTDNNQRRTKPKKKNNAAYVQLLARKYKIKSTCKSLTNMQQTIHVDADEYLKHIAVNDENRLLLCVISDLTNAELRRIFLSSSARDENDRTVDVVDKLKYLNTLETKDRNQRLSQYSKVVVVQDPLERLVTIYRNKFELSPWTRRRENYERLIEFYRRHPNLSKYSRKKTTDQYERTPLTFEEFLSYWTDRFHVQEKLVDDFMSINDVCRPCAVFYDYVIHLTSTGYDELNEVINRLAIDKEVMLIEHKNEKSYHKMTSMPYEMYFDNITTVLFKKVWETVKVDSVMFGYSDSDWLKQKLGH